MKKWFILCGLCLLALFYPCDERPCWDTAGARGGTWTGYVTSDCRFMGTGEWESVAGTINPYPI